MKKSKLIIIMTLFLTSFCFSKTQTMMPHDSLKIKIDLFIKEYLDWYNIPGLSIAVVSDGKVIFSKGYGVRDVKTGERATPFTLYSTASVTKLFVGTAIMQLVEQKLIGLNDPVKKHLPYFIMKDERYMNITILQMLSHTSGLPDIETAELYTSWQNPEYDDQALERYARSLSDVSLISNPGESYSYSNMAYDVLGDLISKISGIPFEPYVKKMILDPLQMEKSTILIGDVDKKLLALPHLMDEKFNYKVSDMMPYSRRHPACGTLFSNVMEMSNWAIACMNRGQIEGKRILQDSSYTTMWRPAVIEDNPFGVSWLIEDFGQYRLLSHGGGDPGYRTEFYIIPEKSLGVVVMANCWEDQINPIAIKALNLMLGENEKDWFSYFQGRIWKNIRNNRVEKTVPFCRDLVRVHGKEVFHPAILNQLGRRLEEMDKTEDALILYQLNTELYPSHFQLLNILAETYLKMGQDSLAIDAYTKSLELNPQNENARKILKDLRN